MVWPTRFGNFKFHEYGSMVTHIAANSLTGGASHRVGQKDEVDAFKRTMSGKGASLFGMQCVLVMTFHVVEKLSYCVALQGGARVKISADDRSVQ